MAKKQMLPVAEHVAVDADSAFAAADVVVGANQMRQSANWHAGNAWNGLDRPHNGRVPRNSAWLAFAQPEPFAVGRVPPFPPISKEISVNFWNQKHLPPGKSCSIVPRLVRSVGPSEAVPRRHQIQKPL